MFKTASYTVSADGQYAHQKGTKTKNLSNKHSMLHNLYVSCLTHRVHGCGGHHLVNEGRVRIAKLVLSDVCPYPRYVFLQAVHHIHQIVDSALDDVQVYHHIICCHMYIVTCDGSRTFNVGVKLCIKSNILTV